MKKKPAISALFLAITLILAVNAGAWWSKKDEKKPAPPANRGQRVQRKYHLHIPDKKTEKELLSMFDGRRRLSEDVKVLQRLDKAKKNQYAAIQKALMDEFSILPETKYYYEDKTMTIFELTPSTVPKDPDGKIEIRKTKKDEPASAFTQKAHRKLKNKKGEKRFMGLIATKKTLHDQLRAIQAMLREQQKGLANVNAMLAAKFSMKSGRYYDYDRKTMKLYEIGPAPTPKKR